MPSLATILTSLEGADRAIRFELVGKLGRIRSRRGGREFFLDFRPYGRVWSNRGIRITDEATAHRLLEQIRGKVAEDQPLEEVLAGYLPAQAKPNLVPVWIEKWLDVKRRETAAGDRSPTYLRELERYGRPGGHFSWWQNRSIHEIEFGTLEDWSHWLADRGLSPKTRHNVIAAFRSFVGWLKRRRQLRELPEFPWPKVPEHDPRVLTLETQDAILDAIPEADRGIFLVLARMGLRPGEAVALQAADYQDGWLHVTRALKGRRLSDPIRAPKNNRGKRLPVDPELEAWIERHVPPERRMRGGLLFENPQGEDPSRRWTPTSLHRRWEAACRAVGLTEPISLYEGTKHTFATNAKRRGVEDRLLQRFLGHRDRRSVERYARLADEALVAVLRPLRPTPESDGLSPACRQGGGRSSNYLESKGNLVEAAGIEPASAWFPTTASTCVGFARSRTGPSRSREEPDPASRGSRSRLRSGGAPEASLLMTPATP